MRFVIIALALYEIFSIAVMPMLPPFLFPRSYSSLSLPFFPSAQATPKLTCKILTHALRGRGLLLCLCLAKCVIPRLARQLGSSLARLTASSNPNECSSLSVWCETRAFCLGPYLDWPSILCKNIFPKKKGCPWQRNCVNNT